MWIILRFYTEKKKTLLQVRSDFKEGLKIGMFLPGEYFLSLFSSDRSSVVQSIQSSSYDFMITQNDFRMSSGRFQDDFRMTSG